jgi:hypothetical protein
MTSINNGIPPPRVRQHSVLDDADEPSPTETVADVIYWLLYRGERFIPDDPASDLSRFAPYHEDLSLLLSTFDTAGGGAKGAKAVAELWPAIRRQWPELAAAVAGQDIRKATQAQLLIRLGIEAELFETSEGQAYARVPINGFYDVLALTERGSGFQPWLARRFYEETLGHPSIAAMAQATLWLRGQARYGRLVHDVHTRVAWHDGVVYLDLANAGHQAIKITADGWDIDSHPPVYFRRASGALPLPYPDDEGNLEDLFALINLAEKDDDTRKLIAGWLVHTLMPGGPYAHLCIHGEQGSAKSFLTKVLRQLVDPNKAPTKSKPKEEHDLAVMARHSYILAFDNVSSLPEWLSDALCQLSTGAGLGTRKLYTDDDETVFFAKRPVILNGIAEVAVRGDLIDRCLFITLPTLARRTDERQLWTQFQEVQPRILGAVVKAVSEALKNRDCVTIRDLPRMADFTLWVEAAAPAFGWKRGTFLTAYRRNRARAVMTELEASPIARALLAAMAHQPSMDVLMRDLLYRLTQHITADGEREVPSTWPRSPQALSGALRRLSPALRAQGIEVTIHDHGKQGTPVSLRQHSTPAVPEGGVGDVIFGDEVGDDDDKLTKSLSPSKTATGAGCDEGGKGDNIFSLSLKEKKNKEEGGRNIDIKVGKSSSPLPPSSHAAMGVGVGGDEVHMSSSPLPLSSSPTSSASATQKPPASTSNGTQGRARGKRREPWEAFGPRPTLQPPGANGDRPAPPSRHRYQCSECGWSGNSPGQRQRGLIFFLECPKCGGIVTDMQAPGAEQGKR